MLAFLRYIISLLLCTMCVATSVQLHATSISGVVSVDKNSNCTYEQNTDIPLANYAFQLVNITTNETYTIITNNVGEFSQEVVSGNYQVLYNGLDGFYASVCATNVDSFTIDTSSITLFPLLRAISQDAFLYVDVSTAQLTPCENSTYTVFYANKGATEVHNTYIDIELNSFLVPTSASLASTPVAPNVYRYYLDTLLPAQTTGYFTFTVFLNCDLTTLMNNMTHCVKATIYPNLAQNAPIKPLTITTDIIADTAATTNYYMYARIMNPNSSIYNTTQYIIEDDLMLRGIPVAIPPNQSNVQIVQLQPGKSYYIATEQNQAISPLVTSPSSSILYQQSNGIAPFTSNFGSWYAPDDREAHYACDCHTNGLAITGVDKMAQPQGYDDAHYIANTTDLTYTIRYKNTTGTAINTITIQDTLSSYLDLSTIEIANTSHGSTSIVQKTIEGNILKLTLTGISLLDNEVGWIKYKIRQIPNNVAGTVISTRASIQMNFGATTTTNPTYHTIKENYIRLYPAFPLSRELLSVYPNPSNDIVNFHIKPIKDSEFTVKIYDVLGHLLHTGTTLTNKYAISRTDLRLANGTYIYNIEGNRGTLFIGKIVLFR